MRAKLFVPAGISEKASGGERSAPSQVNWDGMAALEAKADDDTSMADSLAALFAAEPHTRANAMTLMG
jgi:hypothetical protein